MDAISIIVDKLFKRLDKNGDGVIEAHEVAQEFSGRVLADDLDVFMGYLDINGDGKITKEEASTAIAKFIL